MKREGGKIGGALIFAVFFATFVFMSVGCASATIYVPDNYTKIQWAVDNSSAGDMIIVMDGTYTENVDVNTPHLTIQSENGSDSTIVQSAGGDVVFEVTADYVNISGFTVREGIGGSGIYGIYLYDADYCEVSNNNVHSFYAGIRLHNSSNNIIANNNCSNIDGSGILLWSSSINNTIINNNCSNTRDGINLWRSPSNNISNNSIYSIFNTHYYADGISLYDSSNTLIANNRINSNTDNYGNGIDIKISSNINITNNRFMNCGIFLGSSGSSGKLSYYNTHIMENNTINEKLIYYYSNKSNITVPEDAGSAILANCSDIIVKNINASFSTVGIELVYTKSSTISNNKALSNTRGIYFHQSFNNIISNNDISNTIVGVYPYQSSNNNISNNGISNSYVGLRLSYSGFNDIVKNKVTNSFYGTYLSDESDNNVFCCNNFENNTNNVHSEDSTNTWNSTEKITYTYNGSTYTNYLGNYWSDYGAYLPPVGHNDPDDGWIDAPLAYDENRDTYARVYVPRVGHGPSSWLELLAPAGETQVVRFWVGNSHLRVDIYYDESWHCLRNWDWPYSEAPTNEWVELNYPSEIVEKARIIFNDGMLGGYWGHLYEFQFKPSNYSGSDADGDGIGDTPYSIDGDKDNYPLVEGFENYIEQPSSDQPQLKAPWKGTAKITQGNNGTTSHYDHGTWDNTYAIDVALPVGSDVLATADGTVIWYDDDPGGEGGKELAIQHTGPTGNNFVTVYLHLSDISIKSGAVKQGQVVARSGDTGDVTGPHLHFHMWSGVGSYDSHTIPIERLIMKQVGVDSDSREYDARKGDLEDNKIAGGYFESNNMPLAKPVLTFPLEITPEKDTYYVGDILSAEFTLTNNGDIPITLDKLLVGGRFNGGKLSNAEFPDFTFQSVTLQPNVSHQYTGTLELTQPGIYQFFIAYYIENPTPEEKKLLDENNWNTCADLGEGLTDEDRTEEISTASGYAIIVAGQADWRQKSAIDHSANNAYRALRNLGFDDDHIFYLNSNQPQDVDGDGDSEVDALALLSHFENVINQVKAEIGDNPTPLVFYLTGHGLNDPDCFIFDEGNPSEGYLWVAKFQEELDKFSEGTPMLIVIGSCYSGRFITSNEGISAPNRIIITAAHDDEERKSILGLGGWYHSSDRFWGNLNKGLNVKDAFITDLWPGDRKHLWLDDNGDRIGHPPQNLGNDGALASVTTIGMAGLDDLELTSWYSVWVHSAGELRVSDSLDRVTGLVNGEVREEIPNSTYDEENEIVAIFSPADTYRHEIVGTGEGTYGLDIASIEDGDATTFTATVIPTSPNATHQYLINWTALAQGEEGVTVQIDADGDGTFEQNITIQPPISNFTYTPEKPVINQTITFNASNSTDLDGNITSYKWDFADGTNGTGEKPSHSYASAGNYIVTLTVRDDDGATTSTSKTITINPLIFDTDSSANPYPSIAGTHNGTLTPSYNITVNKLYTYPCDGTGGHTKYAAVSYTNGTLIAEAHWSGYVDDWHNISFNETFTLYENETYNYTICTGSYPQIIHESPFNATGGTITCDKFIDANGKIYYDWIPAIRLFL